MNKFNNFVSVIIPVYNNNEQLKTCLLALENQTYPQDAYEIIVVDNGSDLNIKKELESLVKNFAHIILTEDNIPSSYRARNKGISLAKGEILAFTDSDCIPQSNWLEKGVKTLLENPECGLVGGKIQVFPQDQNQATAVEIYEILTVFKQDQYIAQDHYAATANLFTFKKMFDQIGLFDDTLKSGGDVEWGNRVFQAKFAQIYADDVVIKHPARRSLQELRQKLIRTTSGDHTLKNRQGINAQEFLKELMPIFIPPIKFSINLFQRQKHLSLWQKLMVIYVRLYVKTVFAYEKIRLKLGGKSTAR